MPPSRILIPGSSDLLGPGSPTPLFPRDGAQQNRLSATWGTDFNFNTIFNGDYAIARMTVSNTATGPLAGYVLSNQTATLTDQNFATLSFNNGVLTAAPGSEFALLADANHDNKVNTADFVAVAQNFNQLNSNWTKGDFNGDGKTNALDFNALSTNYGANAGAPLGSVVPEPMTVATVGALSLMLLGRRRRSI
jgi:hypothetical protein